ncbi:MAG: F0F1 ATP synthase subunit delta [Tissierellia bacterium]|nr:F0F1 ATP synthase subunit delta [Tissierellia bacterium]
MNNQVSSVYSQALFDVAVEKEILIQSKDELNLLKTLLEDNPKLRVILENPNIEKREKKDMVDVLMKDSEQNTKNFVKVLLDNNRFDQFDNIVDQYIRRFNEKENIAPGIIYSARALDKEFVAKVEATLSKKLDKKVELENVLDESLIGGFTVKMDGKFVDNSIKGRLENLKSSLKQKRGEL